MPDCPWYVTAHAVDRYAAHLGRRAPRGTPAWDALSPAIRNCRRSMTPTSGQTSQTAKLSLLCIFHLACFLLPCYFKDMENSKSQRTIYVLENIQTGELLVSAAVSPGYFEVNWTLEPDQATRYVSSMEASQVLRIVSPFVADPLRIVSTPDC